jgi:hypothetical protein
LTWSPSPGHYLWGFGLILPLAGLGLWRQHFFTGRKLSMMATSRSETAFRDEMLSPKEIMHSPLAIFLTLWIVLIPLLLYAPTPLQRRFVDGYQADLTVPAAVGLAWLILKLKRNRAQIIALAGVLLLMALTNLFLMAGAVFTIQRQAPPIFHPAYQQDALQWLAGQGPGPVVIAAYETGNILPAYAPVRVFIGHGPETVRSAEKEALLAEFFAPENDSLRRRLIKAYAITHLFYGPREQKLGEFSPSEADYFRQLYDNGTVQIFEVVEP